MRTQGNMFPVQQINERINQIDYNPNEYDDVYIPENGIYTHAVKSGRDYLLHVTAEVTGNDGGKYKISCELSDRNGERVQIVSLERHGDTDITLTVKEPQEWSIEEPVLYDLAISLLDDSGAVMQTETVRTGFRDIKLDPDEGLYLNDEHLKLNGVCIHHDLGALGVAFNRCAFKRRLKQIKAMGANALRLAHNAFDPAVLELADEMGFLVISESFDMWERPKTEYDFSRFFSEWYKRDVASWVKRDRNHPCVVLWSLGNELQTYNNLPFNDWGVTPYRMQKQLLKRYDNTRLVTVAMHPRGRDLSTDSLPAPLALETDIAAYNYRYMYFPGDGRKYPWMIFYQSEANLPMMGPNYYEMDLDRVVGLAYWGMIDYLGESKGWPAKGWTEGVFDISLEPKPMAYFLRSIFKEDEPLVHVSIVDDLADETEWNGIRFGGERYSDHWNRKAGSSLTVYAYSNAEEVELFVNGKSMGKRSNTTAPKSRNKMRWDNVKYEEGYVEAVAMNGGKVVAKHKVETSGSAKRLTLKADEETWKADGTDLMHVRVHAVDSKGRRAYNSQEKLQFSVAGDARIVAVTNGDNQSDELNVVTTRSLYNGSAMVILRAGQNPSNVTLTVTPLGGKMKASKLKLQTH